MAPQAISRLLYAASRTLLKRALTLFCIYYLPFMVIAVVLTTGTSTHSPTHAPTNLIHPRISLTHPPTHPPTLPPGYKQFPPPPGILAFVFLIYTLGR